MDISKFDKAAVLAALYNRAKPQGLGLVHYTPEDMTTEEATKMLKTQTYFDYVKGRVMKVDLGEDKMSTALYNRDNGTNAAEDALVDLAEA